MRRRLAVLLVFVVCGLLLIRWTMRSRASEPVNGPHPLAGSLRAHVQVLAGDIGERNVWKYAALQQAAAYIADEFTKVGLRPERQTFQTSGLTVANVGAAIRGSVRPLEILVVGAHYDSVSGCPGANDNGTGVAALLELARRFASRPQPKTVAFVAFVNEEPPFFKTGLMGSVVYANAAKQRGDRVVGMLSLETMGYYSDVKGSQQYPAPIALLYADVGDFIAFVSNLGSARLLLRARRAFKARTPFPVQSAAVPDAIPGVGWSDHWSFWQAGFPAMMVTDTAPFRYPWYHTANDTPEKINYDKLAYLVDGLEAVIEALAK